MILVSVFDKISDTYAPCYCVDNKAVAIRSFETLVKRGDTDVANFPNDFELIQVAEYVDGIVTPITSGRHLCNASDFIHKPKFPAGNDRFNKKKQK